MKKTFGQGEEGQSLVLIAFLYVALIVMLGLLVDGGRVLAARRQSQNASDAASYAGTNALTTRPDADGDGNQDNGPAADQYIRNAVRTYALANKVASVNDVQAYYMIGTTQGAQVGSNTVPSGATGVRAFATIYMQPFFMSVLSGGASIAARTVSAGQAGAPTEMDNLMPITRRENEPFQFGVSYKLFAQKEGPGNFHWLDFGDPFVENCKSPNEVELGERLSPDAPPSPKVEVGDYVCGAPGMKVGTPVKNALDEWLDEFPEGKRLWTIPIFDVTNEAGGQNFQYHVVKFAVFDLVAYDFQGSDKYIQGRFVRYGRLGHVANPGPCNTVNVPMCVIGLSQ